MYWRCYSVYQESTHMNYYIHTRSYPHHFQILLLGNTLINRTVSLIQSNNIQIEIEHVSKTLQKTGYTMQGSQGFSSKPMSYECYKRIHWHFSSTLGQLQISIRPVFISASEISHLLKIDWIIWRQKAFTVFLAPLVQVYWGNRSLDLNLVLMNINVV